MTDLDKVKTWRDDTYTDLEQFKRLYDRFQDPAIKRDLERFVTNAYGIQEFGMPDNMFGVVSLEKLQSIARTEGEK